MSKRTNRGRQLTQETTLVKKKFPKGELKTDDMMTDDKKGGRGQEKREGNKQTITIFMQCEI